MIKVSVKQSIWPSSFERISIKCITLVALHGLYCCLEHLRSETTLSYDNILHLFLFGGYIILMFLFDFFKSELQSDGRYKTSEGSLKIWICHEKFVYFFFALFL